ncbi:hypothetical protein, partial [Treponema endosymbiont of Eucomonympha sp.]|uniref:hypothetical protein n=1 Tax=Treponema endosymbiont of Eucomonympha sp. TaxID=1580831 RepID=UPI000B329701
MMKKVTVAVFASIMLGAFGACKNEPDTINVTVSPPEVLIPPVPGVTEHHEVNAWDVLVRTNRTGIGGLNETTSRLWFRVDSGNFKGYQPKNVVYAPANGAAREISLSPLVSQGSEQTDGNYWHVYSGDIDPNTPITENGFVSFDLSVEDGNGVYHAIVETKVFYATPVQIEVDKVDVTEGGTTELTAKLSNGKELFYVYVDGVKTEVKDGVVSISNKDAGINSVTVVVK